MLVSSTYFRYNIKNDDIFFKNEKSIVHANLVGIEESPRSRHSSNIGSEHCSDGGVLMRVSENEVSLFWL